MSSVSKQVDFELIGCCATRIVDMATEIERTHALGVPHGEHDEPWTLEFHQVVVSVYLQIVPARYARTLAGVFKRCSRVMATVECPEGVDDGGWVIVSEYVGAVSQSICGFLRVEEGSGVDGEEPLESTVPGVFPYVEIAPLVSLEGVRRLRQAGLDVQRVCERAVSSRPSEEDIEILRLVASGMSQIDIARGLGMSRSSLQRELRRMRERLGVGSDSEAVLLGGRDGWL